MRKLFSTSTDFTISNSKLTFKVFPEDGRPASRSISTASSEMIRLALRWLDDCLTKHESCGQSSTTVLPARLIDVGSCDGMQQRPRLILTATDQLKKHVVHGQTKYLTLSHCWGNSVGFKLTYSTIDTLRSGVPVQGLTKTFKDAISITRRLGYRYIWIDSLCIIQDSTEDWFEQAAVMASIYQNSTATIAALGAADGNAGCFCVRDPLMLQACRLSSRESGDALYVSSCAEVDLERTLSDAPLHKRAWVLQERLLSPRTLNFGSSLIWECRQLNETDSSPEVDHLPFQLKKLLFYHLPGRSDINTQDLEKLEIFGNIWRSLVMTYTQSLLTYNSDKLIAISGIIQEIHDRTGLQNYVGLWEPFVLKELLWAASYETGIFHKTRRAPTWSWAAVDAAVTYKAAPLFPSSKPLWLASVLEISVNATPIWHPGARSPSFEGFVQLVGAPEPMKFKKNHGPAQRRSHVEFLRLNAKWASLGDEYVIHDTLSAPSGDMLYLPLMTHSLTTPGHPKLRSYGLALVESTPASGVYERFGFVVGPPLQDFSGVRSSKTGTEAAPQIKIMII